jgi:hypothetical protein
MKISEQRRRNSQSRREKRERETLAIGDRSTVDPKAYEENELESESLTDDDLFDLLRDDVLSEVFQHLNKIRLAGADVLKHTVIVIGDNPEWPGLIMVQTQCDVLREGFARPDAEPVEQSDEEIAARIAAQFGNGIGESGADE